MPNFEERLDPRSVPASGDLSTKQYLFCIVDTNGQLAVASTAGGPVYGILQDKPAAAGRAGNVAVRGVSKVVAGAAIALGAKVATTNAGKALTATTGQTIVGVARTAAGANNDVISVELGTQQGLA